MDEQQVRHVLGISGGKDSTALAIYMRDRVPNMEYFFCDTGKELQETYEYIDRIEAYLGRPVIRLSSDATFDHWLEVHGGFLPSPQVRWGTKQLKIIPFEKFVGDDFVCSYIGIRADEDREGYISRKPNIKPVFPFKEDGIVLRDVYRILEESGIGLPDYYKWRTRSGCYFCFFQRKAEWVGLKENHPGLFEEAKAYEKFEPTTGYHFTWSQGESLGELERPERADEIKQNYEEAMAREKDIQANRPLYEILTEVHDLEDDDEGCLMCHT